MTLLVPERMLVFSPALAATIGLEEAVLLYQLHDLSVVQGASKPSDIAPGQWFVIEVETLLRLLPFWDRGALQRVSKNMAALGIIQIDSAELTEATQLRFRFPSAAQTASAPSPDKRIDRQPFDKQSIDQRSSAPRARSHNPAPNSAYQSSVSSIEKTAPAYNAPTATHGASLLAGSWQPQDDTLQLLALKNIPRSFALEQLEEFILYWRERGKAEYAWDNKFRKHVIERWQHNLQQVAEKPPAVVLESVWYPSIDALQILERTGISREFIEDTIPEFVLYWRERGDNTGTWNSKFIAHIRRQWARFSNALEHDQEPRPIAVNWQPSEDVYDILRMANIDIQFACELLPEFILFWRDAGTPQRSWNTKFLQHIKYQWATRHHLTGAQPGGVGRAGYSLVSGAAVQVANSAFERLTDRSWATGIVDGV